MQTYNFQITICHLCYAEKTRQWSMVLGLQCKEQEERIKYAVNMCLCVPVGHPVERHRAADVDEAALCGAARYFPAASGDAALRGWCPGHDAPPWSSLQMPSVNQHCLASKAAAACPTALFHLGSPEVSWRHVWNFTIKYTDFAYHTITSQALYK